MTAVCGWDDDRDPLDVKFTEYIFLLEIKQRLSREPQKKETQARANCSAAPTQLALCLRLASIYKAESWQRAVTLGDSTPQ